MPLLVRYPHEDFAAMYLLYGFPLLSITVSVSRNMMRLKSKSEVRVIPEYY